MLSVVITVSWWWCGCYAASATFECVEKLQVRKFLFSVSEDVDDHDQTQLNKQKIIIIYFSSYCEVNRIMQDHKNIKE